MVVSRHDERGAQFAHQVFTQEFFGRKCSKGLGEGLDDEQIDPVCFDQAGFLPLVGEQAYARMGREQSPGVGGEGNHGTRGISPAGFFDQGFQDFGMSRVDSVERADGNHRAAYPPLRGGKFVESSVDVHNGGSFTSLRYCRESGPQQNSRSTMLKLGWNPKRSSNTWV